jgi:ATP-dependent Lhr-like helicase
MEDRGEVLGGRFVSEFSGEQFALAEAAALLRQSVDQTDQRIFQLHACDPLNLAGVISPGARIPARNGNSLLLRDGLVVAAKIGDKVESRVKNLSDAEVRERLINVKSIGAVRAGFNR